MDKLRELRYLTPPIFFLSVLLVGGDLGGRWTIDSFRPNLAVISAGLVALVFPLGFTIQSISINALKWWFCRYKMQPYSACFDSFTWIRIASAVHLRGRLDNYREAASIAFQFEKWDEDFVEATIRLWTAFNIAVGSIAAIILALVSTIVLNLLSVIAGRFSAFEPWYSWLAWWAVSFLLVALFSLSARSTWTDHMRAFEFQALRLDDKGRMPNEKDYIAPPTS